MIIYKATDADMPELVALIHRMKLDERDLKPNEFLLMKEDGLIAAFGRIKQFGNFVELSTLGVRQRFRKKYYGLTLIKALINSTNQDVFLVTGLPDYFRKAGFVECEDGPFEIKNKVTYCGALVSKNGGYVIMKYMNGYPSHV